MLKVYKCTLAISYLDRLEARSNGHWGATTEFGSEVIVTDYTNSQLDIDKVESLLRKVGARFFPLTESDLEYIEQEKLTFFGMRVKSSIRKTEINKIEDYTNEGNVIEIDIIDLLCHEKCVDLNNCRSDIERGKASRNYTHYSGRVYLDERIKRSEEVLKIEEQKIPKQIEELRQKLKQAKEIHSTQP